MEDYLSVEASTALEESESVGQIFSEHTMAMDYARENPTPAAEYEDAEPIDTNATSSPVSKKQAVKVRKYKHLDPETKSRICKMIGDGATFRSTSKIFDVSLRTIHKIINSPTEKLNSTTKAGGHRDRCTKIAPHIVKELASLVSLHSDYTLSEMADYLRNETGVSLAPSTIHRVLKNIHITCKRICRVPKGRNEEIAISQRREWAVTFNKLRDAHCEFVFIDESGFNIFLSRGRGYARVNETPECYGPVKGPNISLIAAMGQKIGVLHELHKGGITAQMFESFLRGIANKIREAYKNTPVVFILDNASIHKSSKELGISIPSVIRDLGFFYLYTVPYTPQLNAIESLFAQIKTYVIREFVQRPETRKNIESVIEASIKLVKDTHITNYISHHAKNVTLCLANIAMKSNDVIINFEAMEEALIEVYDQNESMLLREIRAYRSSQK